MWNIKENILKIVSIAGCPKQHTDWTLILWRKKSKKKQKQKKISHAGLEQHDDYITKLFFF